MSQATAEKGTQSEAGKNLIPFTDALIKFSITEGVISDLEDATKLEITDSASEKVVRKHRQNAKGLEVKINKTRLKLNREFKEKTEQAAGLIAPRITAAYQTLNKKITAIETAREKTKAKMAKAENERVEAIQARFDVLTLAARTPLEYNRQAADIKVDIASLEAFDINEADFQERKIEADSIKIGAIFNAKSALTGREAFEAAQAEAATVKAEQEAEAERLEKEKAGIKKAESEAAKALADEVKKARQHEKEKAEALKKEAADIKAAREQLEADKAAAAKAIAIAEREFVWDAAHLDNFNKDHANALIEHSEYKTNLQAEMDQARAAAKDDWERSEKYKAEAIAREKIIGPDKLILRAIADSLDEMVSGFDVPSLSTDEANALVRDLISSIKSRIHVFDTDATDLE